MNYDSLKPAVLDTFRLLVAYSNDANEVLGISHDQMRTLLGFSASNHIAVLENLGLISREKRPDQPTTTYIVLAKIDDAFRAEARQVIEAYRQDYIHRQRQEELRREEIARAQREWADRRAEQDRIAREKAEEEERFQEAMIAAQRESFNANQALISQRLGTFNRVADQEHGIQVADLVAFFGYPAKRAEFVIVINGVARIERCSVFKNRKGRIGIGGPSWKAGAEWRTDVKFDGGVGDFIGSGLVWVLDGGEPPFALPEAAYQGMPE